ncbi:MAG TPA: hypothetical protein PLL30_17155 [Candidatus Krumholzibacteria bacterium]|nr:hypothetical protein [Candidatus Krumholzibacteria bacterium]HPD73504.1 hypothetical protein [Candidatus Krumholzibacteria bacterium]HRY42290.1 hypothetical protein [Candidatus Krumholzibacteria bacterium]
MANGSFTAEEALLSEAAFRQYVVLGIDRLQNRLDSHERWHRSLAKVIAWAVGILLGVPSLLLTYRELFQVAIRTAGVPQ